jgi:epoxyqueuosine reductase
MMTADLVKQQAARLGFDLCGVASVEAFPELQRMGEWIARGYAGTMGYLPRTAARRGDVRRVLPSARAVIVTGTLYHADRPLSVEVADPDVALISRYAWGDDYHDVIGGRLERLLSWLRAHHEEPFDALAYVDTGPVHERALAQRAGLGWVGRNGCLINADLGSWLFLGEILTSLPLEPDPPAFDQCGGCAFCLEACPTGALVEPGVLDARRCLSYLTIELRREIPRAFREPLGSHVYGCDICQDVCPWNQAAPRSDDPSWQPRPGLDAPRLVELCRQSDEALARLIDGSAMRRAGVKGLRRNVSVALDNRLQAVRAGVEPDPTAAKRLVGR